MSKDGPLITKYGKLMNIVLKNKIPFEEINKYSPELISFIINELKSINPTLAYSFASAYKNDDNITLTSQYEIIKETSDENVRENLVTDFI